jgi:uncharacterized protein (TIGR02246 family)
MTTTAPAELFIAALEAWNTAFNAGDAAAIAGLYVDDARFLPATHQVIVGPVAIQAFFEPMLAAGVTGHANEPIVAGADGSLVYGASRWTVRSRGKDGEEQVSTGIATHVLERRPDGALKIRLHTFN